jgi:hypothetical protein
MAIDPSPFWHEAPNSGIVGMAQFSVGNLADAIPDIDAVNVNYPQ